MGRPARSFRFQFRRLDSFAGRHLRGLFSGHLPGQLLHCFGLSLSFHILGESVDRALLSDGMWERLPPFRFCLGFLCRQHFGCLRIQRIQRTGYLLRRHRLGQCLHRVRCLGRRRILRKNARHRLRRRVFSGFLAPAQGSQGGFNLRIAQSARFKRRGIPAGKDALVQHLSRPGPNGRIRRERVRLGRSLGRSRFDGRFRHVRRLGRRLLLRHRPGQRLHRVRLRLARSRLFSRRSVCPHLPGQGVEPPVHSELPAAQDAAHHRAAREFLGGTHGVKYRILVRERGPRPVLVIHGLGGQILHHALDNFLFSFLQHGMNPLPYRAGISVSQGGGQSF